MINNIAKTVPSECSMAVIEKGWITGEIFFEYIGNNIVLGWTCVTFDLLSKRILLRKRNILYCCILSKLKNL